MIPDSTLALIATAVYEDTGQPTYAARLAMNLIRARARIAELEAQK